MRISLKSIRSHLSLAALILSAGNATAQTTNIDDFKDGADQVKVHRASGFVCPLFIGHFERDAYGERAPSLSSVFCAYSARDGVYGTITLTPLRAAYDPKTALQQEFTEQEGIGGKLVSEATMPIGGGTTPISVYARTYETAALETLHYRIIFSGGTIGNWAVEATVEFGTPRDDQNMHDFLNAVYTEALVHIAKLTPPQGPVIPPPNQAAPPPLAGPAKPR